MTQDSLPMILAGWQDNKYTTAYILLIVGIAKSRRKRAGREIIRGDYFRSKEVRDDLSDGAALELTLKERKEPPA